MTADSAIRAFYQEYDEFVSSPFTYQGVFDEMAMDQILEPLGVNLAGKRVLDVGCGRGLMSDYVEKRDGIYFGVDLTLSASLATRTVKRFAAADAQELPVKSESMDLIFCVDSFEHFPDPVKAAREFRRVLRQGGTVFLSIPNYSNVAGLVKRVSERIGRYELNTWSPFGGWKPQALENFVTPGYVTRVFEAAGFRSFRSIGFDKEVVVGLFPWIWHPRFPGRLASILCRCCAPAGKALVHLLPRLSLHMFWAIS